MPKADSCYFKWHWFEHVEPEDMDRIIRHVGWSHAFWLSALLANSFPEGVLWVGSVSDEFVLE